MSEKPFTLRVRIGNNEIELSGSQADVLKTIDNLQEIVSKFTGALGSARPVDTIISAEAKPIQTAEEDYPSITISPETPCPDAIIKILSTEWGRKSPRRLNDLLEAMKVNAIHYPLGTVKGRLTDLTKRGVLRRVMVDGGYGYILIKSA
ncbi:MAG: hypothetical protein QG670_2013 [Thermoproteota archaeon]|nr:hypothetical protein [Thermoproteota archaeon]